MEGYKSLTDQERQFCRMLAVVTVPVAATNLAKCLNAAGIECPGAKPWKRQDVLSFIESESIAPLVRVIVEGGSERFCLAPALSCLLWGEAVNAGEFPSFNEAVEKVLDLNRIAARDWRFNTRAAFVRAARVAITESSTERLFVMLEKARRSEWMWNDGNMDDALGEALASFIAPGQLAAMSTEMAATVFPFLLTFALVDEPSYHIVSNALFNYSRKVTIGFELLRADQLIMHGRMDEAEKRLSVIDDPQTYSVRAFIALSKRGDEAEALSLYEEGLKKMKPKAYVSWTGMFYPILLHKLCPIAGERRMKGYVNNIEFWGMVEDFRPLEAPLRRLLKIERTGTGEQGEDLYDMSFERRGLITFFYLILMYWLGEDGAELREEAAALEKRLDGLGLTFLSAELRAAWGENENGVPHPLAGILPREEEWERSLSALTDLGGDAPRIAEDARVVWKVDWEEEQDGCVSVVELMPVEQIMQKRGWSKGRNIALRRLARDSVSIPGMTEQDIRASTALHKEYDYYGTEYVFDIPQALMALAGHPFIFKGDSGERVEVSASDPVISTRKSGRSYVLEISPFPEEGEKFSIALDGPNHLRVTRFEKQHLRVARILGPSGLKVPSRAEGALMKAVESLAAVATVQSDLSGLGNAVEEVEADARLFVQIQPDGPGLAVAAVVRPFGAGSVSCRPGEGGATLIGLMDGKRVRAVRDLKAEADAFLSLQNACPALSEGEAVGDGWRLPEPALALEFLSQLNDMGEDVVVEWPRGQSMKLTYPSVGEGSFTASIRQAQDWFALTGELRLDEDMVIGMKTLLDNINGQYGRFVPLGNGEFLALTREFRRRLKALAALGDERGGELRLPAMAAVVADELLYGSAQVDAPVEWKKRLSLIDEAGKLEPVPPSTFKGELRDYQTEGFRWLMRLAHWGAGACLADDMGLGKTIQVLAVLAARGSEGPSLVVAPTSVCSNWLSEAARFAPTLNVKELRNAGREELLAALGPMDVVVASYGILQNELERLSVVSWNVIVLDESQAIKNMGTKRSSAVMKLNGAFRVATTGTPVENRLSELWNLFRFLNPGYLGSLDSFWRRFGSPIEKNGDYEARERLRRMIRPFILRRTKQQVLSELPGKTEITLKVDLKDEERAFYEALRRGAVEELSGVSRDSAGQGRFQVLAALMKLRRACCCSSLVNADIDLPSAKLEAFADVLTELRAGGHKALVFSQFVDHLSVIRRWLDKEGVPYQYLDGSTPPDERTKRVAAFQSGEGDCFLISLKAGGTGLNLTAADYVIHMDPWWNPAVEAQASDRAHRIGQERPVTVYRIVARDTIEEKIVSLHEWKRGLADGLLADNDSAVTLSVEELLNLIKE